MQEELEDMFIALTQFEPHRKHLKVWKEAMKSIELIFLEYKGHTYCLFPLDYDVPR